MGLTKGQQEAFDRCMSGKDVFITGGGGVGKTYLIKQVVAALEDTGHTVILTAFTGAAAQLIGGSTCHRVFRIPLSVPWKKRPYQDNYDHIVGTDVIIIDEISMVRMDTFDYIISCIEYADRFRRSKGKRPIQLIVIGDFFQTPPVLGAKKDGSLSDSEILAGHYGYDAKGWFAFQSEGWKRRQFSVVDLREVVRQSDKEDAAILNRIRFGEQAALPDLKRASRKTPFRPDEKDVVHYCGKNSTANHINTAAIGKLPGPEKTYCSIVTGSVTGREKPCPDRISLRVGVTVMMLVNSDNYVNGSVGTITHLDSDCVSVRLNSAKADIIVGYHTWDITSYVINKDDGEVHQIVVGSYSQLPLKLAYAITFHKSQGQTVKKAVLHIGKAGSEIFSDGQFYVGVSRVTELKNLYIDGDLGQIQHFASQTVIDYYASIGITLDPAQGAGPKDADPEDAQTQKNEKKKPRQRTRKGKETPVVIEKDRKPEPQKQARKAEKKKARIAVTAFQRPVIIAFAQVLDPEAYADDSSIIVSEGCADAVKDFLAKL